MELGINGKTALVTAASRGLGFAAADRLAREGATVHLCSRNADRAEAAASRIRGSKAALGVVGPPVVHAHAADLDSAPALDALVAGAVKLSGRVDVLVFNTGGPPTGEFLDFDDAAWEKAVNQVLMSAVRLSRLVAPGMRAAKWGRIVYITSMTVKEPQPRLLFSNALRAAIAGMAKTQANEWGPDGVTVNVVCPGMFGTERLKEIYTPEQMAAKAAGIPLRRIGRPEELANLIAFLASDAGSYISGQAILADGGLVASMV